MLRRDACVSGVVALRRNLLHQCNDFVLNNVQLRGQLLSLWLADCLLHGEIWLGKVCQLGTLLRLNVGRGDSCTC